MQVGVAAMLVCAGQISMQTMPVCMCVWVGGWLAGSSALQTHFLLPDYVTVMRNEKVV
jgi:hypothetical protein